MRETSTVIDDGCCKQVCAEMTDAELEDRLFTHLWLSLQRCKRSELSLLMRQMLRRATLPR